MAINKETPYVGDSDATPPDPAPPVDNAHVAEGAEKFSDADIAAAAAKEVPEVEQVPTVNSPDVAPSAPEGEDTEAKGPLPDDFPGRTALGEAGINTYGQLRKHDDLTDIAGIGPATADKIAAALSGE